MEPQKPVQRDDSQLAPEIPRQVETNVYTEPEVQPFEPSVEPIQQYQQTSPNLMAASPLQPTPPVENPGKGIAIAGIVLAFLPLQLIGIILSIIAIVKSRNGTSVRTMGVVGVILNSIGMIATGILLAITVVAFNGVQTRAFDQQSKQSALTVEKVVETYLSTNATLPKTKADLINANTMDITAITLQQMANTKPANATTIEYAICGDTTARIGRWDYVNKKIDYTYIGDKDSSVAGQECTVITE